MESNTVCTELWIVRSRAETALLHSQSTSVQAPTHSKTSPTETTAEKEG